MSMCDQEVRDKKSVGSEGVKASIEAARVALLERLGQGASGIAATAAYADQVDRLVVRFFAEAFGALTEADRDALGHVAVVATGGYGRRELCPFSDLDLIILCDNPMQPAAERLAERMLYPLWDARLRVGHSVRSVESSISQARTDLTMMTALLDVRHVVSASADRGVGNGHRGPENGSRDAALGDPSDPFVSALRGELGQALQAEGTNRLIGELMAEGKRRHSRFFETVYLLEPDLKSGPGGLRDLSLGVWAAKARFQVRSLGDLVGRGELSASRLQALEAALDFYLSLRSRLHLLSGRLQDQLTFEAQETIAPQMYPETRPEAKAEPGDRRIDGMKTMEVPTPAVAPAVEELMRSLQLHAKAVRRESERLLERCIIPPRAAPRIRRIDSSFLTFNGMLQAQSADVFRERPSEMMRIFRVALDEKAELHGHTKDVLTEEAWRLTGDAAAGAQFLELLCDSRDARSPSLLELMHDLGLLSAIMPEFGPCTGRVQHDIYHVYTVDQHSLYTIVQLKALLRGDLGRAHSLATETIAKVVAGGHRVGLFLGTLLHDVGKPLGKNHSEKGAALCASICKRLGVAQADAKLAEFLVLKHLVMAHLSQRRDIEDMALIEKFGAEMENETNLASLYLLTFADMSSVAPGNLTAWKEMLLGSLYERTSAFLARGPDWAARTSSALVHRRKRLLLGKDTDNGSGATDEVDPPEGREGVDAAGSAHAPGRAGKPGRTGNEDAEDAEPVVLDDAGVASRFVGGMPDRYFATTPPALARKHVALWERRRKEGLPVAVAVEKRPLNEVFAISVCAPDTPGLLARICGVLLASKLDIHAAQIASWQGGPHEPREAIDVFHLRLPHKVDGAGTSTSAADTASRMRKLEQDFFDVFSGKKTLDALLEERRSKSALPRKKTPAVPTEIRLDNLVSTEYTVIDVYTHDRPGVLYAITGTLADLNLDVYFSKVGSEANRVADVFYVQKRTNGTDQTGPAKITDPAEISSIKQALAQALETAPKS